MDVVTLVPVIALARAIQRVISATLNVDAMGTVSYVTQASL
jgi:hypothetical protein